MERKSSWRSWRKPRKPWQSILPTELGTSRERSETAVHSATTSWSLGCSCWSVLYRSDNLLAHGREKTRANLTEFDPVSSCFTSQRRCPLTWLYEFLISIETNRLGKKGRDVKGNFLFPTTRSRVLSSFWNWYVRMKNEGSVWTKLQFSTKNFYLIPSAK